MTPSIGRIVNYVLNESDADHANRRRTDGGQIRKMMANLHWPPGAQAHIGNPVKAGDVFPMMIVQVWPSDTGSVNGQVFLDGCDVLWVTSRSQVVSDSADKNGLWFEPPRTPISESVAQKQFGGLGATAAKAAAESNRHTDSNSPGGIALDASLEERNDEARKAQAAE